MCPVQLYSSVKNWINILNYHIVKSSSYLPWKHQCSLVPRPLPDFISQPWRRRPGIKTTSRTGNGGLGYYKPSPRYVLMESTISGPWRSFDPRPSPDFSPQLHGCKIKSGSVLGTRLAPMLSKDAQIPRYTQNLNKPTTAIKPRSLPSVWDVHQTVHSMRLLHESSESLETKPHHHPRQDLPCFLPMLTHLRVGCQ